MPSTDTDNSWRTVTSIAEIRQFDASALSPENQAAELNRFEQRLHHWSASTGKTKPTGPVVSIETPVIKGGWLMPCIESALHQTYAGWVFSLLWDEGDDLSQRILQIVEGLDHPKLQVFYGKNRGVAPARRFLTEHSSSDYILSLDDDDMLAPRSLEKLTAVAEKKPWCSIVRAQRDFIDDFGNWVDEAPWFPFESRHYEHGMVSDIHNHCQPSLIRRASYNKTSGWEGFEEFLFAGEDCDVYLKVEEVGSIELLDEILYHYRLHGKRTSRVITDEAAFEMWRRLADKTINRIGLPLRRLSDKPPFRYERLPRQKTTKEMVDFLICSTDSDRNRTVESLRELGISDDAIHAVGRAENGKYQRNQTGRQTARQLVCYIDGEMTISGASLDVLLASMDEKEADVVSPKIMFEGTVRMADPGFNENGEPVVASAGDSTAEAQWLPSSFLLVRHEVIKAVGGFDDLHFDRLAADIDFCLKARFRDLKCVFVGTAEAVSHTEPVYRTEDAQKLREKWAAFPELLKPCEPARAAKIQSRFSIEYEEYFELGNRLAEEDRLEEAITAYTKAIEFHTTFFWSYFNMGNVLYRMERWPEATAAFETAAQLDPSVVWAHNNLGNALSKLERWEPAAAAYRKAIELEPTIPSSHENLGNALFKLQRWEEAITSYEKALAMQPDSFNLLYNLGDVYMEIQDWKTAAEAYGRAAESDPSSFWARNNFGNAMIKMKRWSEATAAYQEALQLKTDYAGTYQNMGHALIQLERWNEAAAAYRRATELEPGSASSLENLANALTKLERWEEAAVIYEELAKLKPYAFLVHHNLGDIQFRLERYEKAATAFQRAVELNPQFYVSCENLGNALSSLERWSDAAEAYGRAVALNPYLFWSHHNMGNALTRAGRPDEAIEAFECAIEVNPKISLPHHDLADALMKLGKWDQAAAEYRRADELNAPWSKYSPTPKFAELERWTEERSHGATGGNSTEPSGSEATRLMFILDTDYGELTTVMYMLLGRGLVKQTTLLLPPRLYINNSDCLPGRTLLYNSFEDIVRTVEAERPDVVFLCAGYLFSIHQILPLDGLRKLTRFLSDRGCRIVTTDPFLYTLATASLETISIDIPEHSPPQLQKVKYEQDRRLVEHFCGSFEVLKDLPHLYPAYPATASEIEDCKNVRTASFFNPELICPVGKSQDETPLWFFILASRDYELQTIFHGKAWVIENLVAKFEDTVRAGRRAVFIGPYDCVQALLMRMPETKGVSLLTYCSFKRFASLLLGAEYAFYWNVVSHTMLLRLFNEQPIFMLDRGHLVRNVKPLYGRVVDWYYQGHEPIYLDQEQALDPDLLASLAAGYRDTAGQIAAGLRRSPSPEGMLKTFNDDPTDAKRAAAGETD